MKKVYQYDAGGLPNVICDNHSDWVDMYNTAWKYAADNIEYPCKGGWKSQMTCMPGRGILWQWDSCLMALFARFSNDSMPVMNNLDNLYRLQREDGYMSMAYFIDTEEPAYGERINPPLFAWAEWEYFLVSGDDTRFKAVLPKLVKYFDWIKTHRRRANGLYWFTDSGSSGMDNSPRGALFDDQHAGSGICFVDLACQQALTCLYLCKIAGHTGDHAHEARFTQEYEELSGLINERHWCEKTGIYFDLFNRSEAKSRCNFINHKTIAAFWPILAGVANEYQVNKLMEHLADPAEFMRPHPLPTLSADDPNYDPLGGYWRGGVWAPTNYMVTKGLKCRDRHDLARDIAARHLNSMVEVYKNESYNSIWECYSPEYVRPALSEDGVLVRSDFVGWTGLGPIAMLIENILGFGFDARNNRISWNIGTKGRHGIENLHFNKNRVSLVCENWSVVPGKTRIHAETTGTVALRISFAGKSADMFNEYVLPAGQRELTI